MQSYRRAALRLALVLLLGILPTTALGLDLAEKVKLQATMQSHIDELTVDGVFSYSDETTGEVHALHPVVAHPKIVAGDGYQVLCFDFRDDQAERVSINFFMATKGNGYVVFRTAVEQQQTSDQITKADRVTEAR